MKQLYVRLSMYHWHGSDAGTPNKHFCRDREGGGLEEDSDKSLKDYGGIPSADPAIETCFISRFTTSPR